MQGIYGENITATALCGRLLRSSKLMVVDLVYTWVNPNDEDRNALRAQYLKSKMVSGSPYVRGAARHRDRGELKHSIMTVRRYLPFIRNIYVVHGGEVPTWLSSDGQVTFVDQDQLLPSAITPQFQSDIIEAYIYRIPGLSERYIYSNDDFFFSQLHNPEDFFTSGGVCRVAVGDRFAGLGEVDETYAAMERNCIIAVRDRARLLPALTDGKRRPGIPIDNPRHRAQALLKGMPFANTTTHVSQPFLKSRWSDFHSVFRKEVSDLGGYRFRSAHGYTINLMYHLYLRQLGDAHFYFDDRHLFLDWQTDLKVRERLRDALLKDDPSVTRYCLNDHPDAGNDNGWGEYLSEIEHLLATKIGRVAYT